MVSRRMPALGGLAALLLFVFSLGLLVAPHTALATDRVVLGELFSRDN